MVTNVSMHGRCFAAKETATIKNYPSKRELDGTRPKHRGFGLREPWIQILPPPFDSYVTLGILFIYLLNITQNEFMFRWGNTIMSFNSHSDIHVRVHPLPRLPTLGSYM